MSNFWDFSVWGVVILFAVILISLLVGNTLKKVIPGLSQSLIPTSVIGGAILLIVAAVYKAVTGNVFFDEACFGGNGSSNLEIITYHFLALGFIASAFKTSDGKLTKKRNIEIFNTGVTTVSTYLLQGVVGFGITLIAGLFMAGLFTPAGLLLPFGYGQGTGQAMNYGTIYETEYGFAGGKSFGLTIAALGFLSASLGGVLHLMYLKRNNKDIVAKRNEEIIRAQEIQSANEIPMQESIDKLSIQIAFVVTAYLLAFFLMYLLGLLLPGMKSVVFGFNFLIGVLAATLMKSLIKVLRKKNVIKKDYINNFLMTRICNFFFDVMVVAGIAAIRLDLLEDYWGLILILGLVGAVITYVYNRIVAKTLFREYCEEQFLTMYGMLTGTASTGVILLREIDPEFQTPAADNLVLQNFPAIVFGFPMMLLATLAPKKPMLTFGILVAFFVVMNIILFRSKIFRKKGE